MSAANVNPQPEPAAPNPDDEVCARLRSIWQRNLPALRTQLDLLTAAAAQALPGETRAEAESIAHKLAGSLGMFGYAEGTALARQIETALGTSSPDSRNLPQLVQDLRASLSASPEPPV